MTAMSLRPRYSLLTLLVLTALVAGGVKLWYGPHHVVERAEKDFEEEYTYYKNWDASKIINGPHVVRLFEPNGNILAISINFYRAGIKLPWEYELNIARPTQVYPGIPRVSFLRNYQMSAGEQLACRKIIELEHQRFTSQGIKAYDSLTEAVSETSRRSVYLE